MTDQPKRGHRQIGEVLSVYDEAIDRHAARLHSGAHALKRGALIGRPTQLGEFGVGGRLLAERLQEILDALGAAGGRLKPDPFLLLVYRRLQEQIVFVGRLAAVHPHEALVRAVDQRTSRPLLDELDERLSRFVVLSGAGEARRRLVGAIALVLLMVIVLPMVLKDRSATQSQDKPIITMPSEQQTVR